MPKALGGFLVSLLLEVLFFGFPSPSEMRGRASREIDRQIEMRDRAMREIDRRIEMRDRDIYIYIYICIHSM